MENGGAVRRCLYSGGSISDISCRATECRDNGGATKTPDYGCAKTELRVYSHALIFTRVGKSSADLNLGGVDFFVFMGIGA